MKNFILTTVIITFICLTLSQAQISISPSNNASLMANTLVGPGITISNATYTGGNTSSGLFSNGNTTNLGIDAGVVMTSGNAALVPGPNNLPDATGNLGLPGDANLTALSGFSTNDASVLEFDFETFANQFSISFVFGSEEYLEWVNSQFNDVFAFLVTGPQVGGGNHTNHNIATIPVNVPITINTINPGINSSYYVNNPAGPGTTIQYDGFTVKITVSLNIVPCQSYHFKLAIADGSDFILDSGIFLEEASFSAGLDCQPYTLVLGSDGTGTVSADDLLTGNLDDCDFAYEISQSSFTCADEGENEVVITADDGNGNILTCTTTVNVVIPNGLIQVNAGDQCRPVYLGYEPLQCADINATATGGTGPYTYSWSNGMTGSSINVCPNVTTNYYVTATDVNGCEGVAGPYQVVVVDVRCGKKNDKVEVCHIPPGNPDNAHTICISPNGVPAHLAHGCYLGSCDESAIPCETETDQIIVDHGIHSVELVEFTASPNPGSLITSLQIPEESIGPYDLMIQNPTGQIVMKRAIKDSAFTSTLDLSSLNPGLYLVILIDAEGNKYQTKWQKI